MKLRTEADVELIKKLAPDIVVIATGSTPIIPNIPGVELPHVMTVDKYLWERPEVGDKVVVLGNEEPAEVALSLARDGKSVTIISPTKSYMDAPYLYYSVRQYLLNLYLKEAGVKIVTEAKIERITREGVEIITKEGKRELAEADNVILAFGRKPEDKLAKELKGIVPQVIVIGDAKKPAHIQHAIHSANIVARFMIP